MLLAMTTRIYNIADKREKILELIGLIKLLYQQMSTAKSIEN
jgi:hypothetical protein